MKVNDTAKVNDAKIMKTQITCYDGMERVSIPLEEITLVGGLINKVKMMEAVGGAEVLFLTNEVDIGDEYDRAQIKGFKEIFLQFLRVEDSSITKIESRDTNLVIHKGLSKNVLVMSASDNLSRLAIMAARIINDRILAINEIENGLHYPQYEKLWVVIFKAVRCLEEAQVFATTHSLEMIKAFVKISEMLRVTENGYIPSNCYVEIAVSERMKKLIAIKRDAETVIYAIQHDDGVRGEADNEDSDVNFNELEKLLN